jgi:hypothetical protein
MMEQKYWVRKQTGYTPLMIQAGGTIKLFDLTPNMIVENAGSPQGDWTPVRRGDKTGWVKTAFIEDYPENLKVDCVYVKDIQTPDPYDAQQYVRWKGFTQVNMCGEMSAVYLLNHYYAPYGTQITLSDFLLDWERKSPSFFARIFPALAKARGTGIADLQEMFSLWGIATKPLTGEYSPGMLSDLSNRAIISTRLNTTTGRLNGSGVGHWAAPIGAWDERQGYGTKDIYNSFPNREERYSYAELLASARQPYGIEIL